MVTIDAFDRGRDNNFNLIRTVAAFGVLISHAWPISLGPGAAEPLSNILMGTTLGTVCVIIFFVISGYFIAKSYDRSQSARVFLTARALRLFPALAVVLLVTVLAGFLLTTSPVGVYAGSTPEYFLRNFSLFFLQFELPGVFESNPYGAPINGSLWTLRHEVACYFGVLLLGVVGLLNRPVLTVGVLALLANSVFGFDALLGSRLLEKFLELALPFALGSAAYVWRQAVPLNLWVGAVLVIAAVLSHGTPMFHAVFATALSYLSLCAGFMFKVKLLLGFNSLGDPSYGIYIYAFPIQQFLAWLGVATPLVNILIAGPLVIILGFVSWRYIEKPALALRFGPKASLGRGR